MTLVPKNPPPTPPPNPHYENNAETWEHSKLPWRRRAWRKTLQGKRAAK